MNWHIDETYWPGPPDLSTLPNVGRMTVTDTAGNVISDVMGEWVFEEDGMVLVNAKPITVRAGDTLTITGAQIQIT